MKNRERLQRLAAEAMDLGRLCSDGMTHDDTVERISAGDYGNILREMAKAGFDWEEDAVLTEYCLKATQGECMLATADAARKVAGLLTLAEIVELLEGCEAEFRSTGGGIHTLYVRRPLHQDPGWDLCTCPHAIVGPFFHDDMDKPLTFRGGEPVVSSTVWTADKGRGDSGVEVSPADADELVAEIFKIVGAPPAKAEEKKAKAETLRIVIGQTDLFLNLKGTKLPVRCISWEYPGYLSLALADGRCLAIGDRNGPIEWHEEETP